MIYIVRYTFVYFHFSKKPRKVAQLWKMAVSVGFKGVLWSVFEHEIVLYEPDTKSVPDLYNVDFNLIDRTLQTETSFYRSNLLFS